MPIMFNEFNPNLCSRKQWKLFHEFRKSRHIETGSNDSILSDDDFEKLLKKGCIDEFTIKFSIFENKNYEKQIGFLSFSYLNENSVSYKGNEDICNARIIILRPYRRKGYATILLRKIVELMQEHKKNTVKCYTIDENGRNFLKAINAKINLEGIDNKLYIKDINWNMIDIWIKEGQKRSNGTNLTFYEKIPEGIIREYSKIYTEIFNQQPFDELTQGDKIFTPESLKIREEEFEELGGKIMTAVTFEKSKEISGLTEVIYVPSRKSVISQGLTGVRQKYRGKGLGKWLKAVMLLKIRSKFPQVETIETGNANSNIPMLSINFRLGFKKEKKRMFYQISVELIKEYLNKCDQDSKNLTQLEKKFICM
ncbi:MAG: GNAT family N-acetyltransferase [Candidatus Thorarchaeota archaeon]